MLGLSLCSSRKERGDVCSLKGTHLSTRLFLLHVFECFCCCSLCVISCSFYLRKSSVWLGIFISATLDFH